MKNKLLSIFVTVVFAVPFTLSMYINIAFATTKYPQSSKNVIPYIELKDDLTSSVSPTLDAIQMPEASTTPYPSNDTVPTPSALQSPAQTPLPTASPSPDTKKEPSSLNDEKISVNVYDRASDQVITMSLHDYLICVVAAEMPATFELEALKAQAVAARTFTVKHMSASCSGNSNAHVCTYYGCCQAYVSTEKMKKNWDNEFNAKFEKIKAAVESTDSLIMTYNNKPITVFYFSTSNGYTEACQDVFVKDLPYYKSVESPGEENAPNYHSYVKISKKEFCNVLSGNFDIDISADNIEHSLEYKYTPGKRVAYIYFNGKGIKGTSFRTAFGLKSADFKLIFYDDYILIDVHGYGHGVGMSQLGANAMAKNSACFDDILSHYYIDTELSIIK